MGSIFLSLLSFAACSLSPETVKPVATTGQSSSESPKATTSSSTYLASPNASTSYVGTSGGSESMCSRTYASYCEKGMGY